MKLYTEKQMRQCYEGVLQNVGTSIKQSDLPKVDEYINSLTPIELPSDDEINEAGKGHCTFLPSFVYGAQWMRDKIQGGNK
jgi:hypothetical protein